MNPKTKLYIKVFLMTGIPFGIMMTGFDMVNGARFDLWEFLFLTFFFGIMMSWTLVAVQYSDFKKNGKL